MAQQSQTIAAAILQQANPPICPFAMPFGDSIVYGVNAATLAGWRGPLYNTIHPLTQSTWFVGSQSFDGNAHGLAADPYCEGYPGYAIAQGLPSIGSLIDVTISGVIAAKGPQIVIAAGGTNDMATSVGNQTAAATLTAASSWLDAIWARRTYPRFRIVFCNVLKRLDADDAKVQTYNAGLAAVIAGKSYSSSVILADVYNATAADGMNDAVHPNDTGYTRYAATLRPYVQQAIAAT